MEAKDKLNIDEILVLKWRGLTPSQIAKTSLQEFDKLYEEGPDEFDRLIEKANSILNKQEAMGIKTISIQDEDYPERLKKVGNEAPVLIHLMGNSDLLKREKAVAIIGARSADREGNAKAHELGKKYAEEGNVIVSGLALGCDKAGHEGCLAVNGETIAIVGSGLDIVHPKENADLQKRILEAGGLILSEQLIKTKVNPTTLVARNRLQAALSDIVILAQCPAQSGSLHTMRFARQYRKRSLAVKYPKKTEANVGNFNLIENNLAQPL